MLKVGDKVIIRKDLLGRTRYNGTYVAEEMGVYRGLKAKIIRINDLKYIHLDIDEGWWIWTEAMFESKVIKPKPKPYGIVLWIKKNYK